MSVPRKQEAKAVLAEKVTLPLVALLDCHW